MITLIEALNFRCLRYISRPMDNFHVLVGPNASGKTTFLDVVAFLGDLVSGGIEKAVAGRTRNFEDLVWRRSGPSFELAIEARIPETLSDHLADTGLDTIRYEVALALDSKTQEIQLQAETVLLKAGKCHDGTSEQLEFFPGRVSPPRSILLGVRGRDTRAVVQKVPAGNDNFYSETYVQKGKGWVPTFKLGPRRSALANLPEDESKFPVATWLKALLSEGVQQLILNSLLIRKASPPGQGRSFRPDGSNLPWVVADLERNAPERLRDWVAHLQTALPDLESIWTLEREDDKHRYLMLG
ncbi:MAG: AAA family ATPase [Acidobacteria bacterium]|nr:AAA family ATPase [Acidobacteriota bacterium]